MTAQTLGDHDAFAFGSSAGGEGSVACWGLQPGQSGETVSLTGFVTVHNSVQVETVVNKLSTHQ